MRAPGLLLVVPALLATAQAGAAQTPSELVRTFYEQTGRETDPAARGDFVDPAKQVLDDAEKLKASGQGDCLDANMALDNAAYDRAELERSLKIIEAVNGETAKVVAAFMAGGTPHRMEWRLEKAGENWKVADFISVTNEWKLSQYNCE